MHVLIIASLFLFHVANDGQHAPNSSHITSVIGNQMSYSITTQVFNNEKTCEDAGKKITLKFPSVRTFCVRQ
jgi:hypothetical protein